MHLLSNIHEEKRKKLNFIFNVLLIKLSIFCPQIKQFYLLKCHEIYEYKTIRVTFLYIQFSTI